MEVWTVIEDFPKYVISPEGYIQNRDRGAPVKTRQNRQGVVMASLMGSESRRTRSVALMVAQAYLGEPRNPSYNSVIHLDGDRGNCEANNLAWRPRWYAIRYHKMFDEEPINVSVYIDETGETFGTLREACVKYGLIEKYAYVDLCNGDRSFHHGYRFRRATEY